MYQHHTVLSQNIKNLVNVIALLQTEKILTEEAITSIEAKPSLLEKRKALLASVQDAVCNNPRNLWVFGNVLQNVADNEPLAVAILNDYCKYNNVQYSIIVITRYNIY